MLRDFYGTLLTSKQDEMLRLRYDEDLSFGEIAEICGVSRQAVLDSINKGERHLAEFEENLKCLDKQRRIVALLNEIESAGEIDAFIKDRIAQIRKILED